MEDEEEQMVEESYQIYLLKKAEKEKEKSLILAQKNAHVIWSKLLRVFLKMNIQIFM